MTWEDFRPSIDRQGCQRIISDIYWDRGKIGVWWYKSQQLDPRSRDLLQLSCRQVRTDMQPYISLASNGRLFGPLYIQRLKRIDRSFERDRALAQGNGQCRLAETQDRNEEEEKGEELIHLKMAYGKEV